MSNNKIKKQQNLTNFILSIMDTWQIFNNDIPNKMHSAKHKERMVKERARKLGSRASNKKNSFSLKEIAIIKELVSNPRKSYVEVAKSLGLSRHTVKKKIERMLFDEKIKIYLGVNQKKISLDLIVLQLLVDNLRNLENLFQELKNCPRVFSISKDISKNALLLLLGIEKMNDNNLLAIVIEKFQFDDRIKESNVISLFPEVFPEYLVFNPENHFKDLLEPPCQIRCENCKNFINGKCIGCPATEKYIGTFFKMA
ncbi:MAG: AsnC family transcriptional regulator [Candidatus Helarchaeota archaeon]